VTQPVVQKVARQAERRKPNNQDLPEGIDQKLWRRVFISTYMRWVASQPNPWEIPVALACQMMQLILDAISPDISYEVTSSGSVYLLVCGDVIYDNNTDSYL